MRRLGSVALPVALVLLALAAPRAAAALDAEQRRELTQIRSELRKATPLVRQKKFDEARQLVDELDKRLDDVIREAGVDEKDRTVQPLKRQIAQLRLNFVTFTDDVAPILARRCLNCHGDNNPGGGLRLGNFAGLRQGGQSQQRLPLVVPGQPQRSLLMARLTAPPNQRMPKDGEALPADEIQTIAAWINLGAPFDGDDENTPLAELAERKSAASRMEEPVEIPRPRGDETVSFVNDVAPFMVNLCLRCHSGNNPRSGFSIETFERLMTGGDSGQVVIPGDLEGSRLFRLVGGLENPRMPQGQARITRKNYEDLRTWISEGAAFDGEDPKARLRDLVPTEAELRAEALARMSPEEFAEMRKYRSEEVWERVLPNDEFRTVESAEFFIYGNVPEPRLNQVRAWAEEHAKSLRSLFGENASPLWKGKLTLFVFKDRYGYEEFNLVIQQREAPRQMKGHTLISANLEDAYVVLEDVGDRASADAPDLQVSLVEQLTSAFLQRSGTRLPDWVLRGTGLALAARANSKNEYIEGLRDAAPETLKPLQKPEDVFANGTFSPAGVAAVGYTLVDFLLKAGGQAKFSQFIGRLQEGTSVADAVQGIYNSNLASLAASYASSLRGRRR